MPGADLLRWVAESTCASILLYMMSTKLCWRGTPIQTRKHPYSVGRAENGDFYTVATDLDGTIISVPLRGKETHAPIIVPKPNLCVLGLLLTGPAGVKSCGLDDAPTAW